MSGKFQEIRYTVEDGAATITLNRPQAYNAVTPEMRDELVLALQEAQRDDAVNVVILTGAGRTFCAGANPRNLKDRIEALPSIVERRNELRDTVHRVARAIAQLDKPLIAAVNGPAAGGGMDIATECDIRIASDQAKFRMAYVRMGVIPAEGGCYFLPRIIGASRAKELIWTARSMDAHEALRIGYVSRVVAQDDLMPVARELAQQIARGPAVAIQISKRLIYRCLHLNLDQALEATEQAMLVVRSTEDAKEGPRAWVEKREPRFQGR
ncbi:MAG: enoyl-CoA hydratase/isomerase family protein [Chloroflexi bacterium]|nr:enoyl-CoA hydratase/isomerase family protein [Chloroflexota bacterium]